MIPRGDTVEDEPEHVWNIRDDLDLDRLCGSGGWGEGGHTMTQWKWYYRWQTLREGTGVPHQTREHDQPRYFLCAKGI